MGKRQSRHPTEYHLGLPSPGISGHHGEERPRGRFHVAAGSILRLVVPTVRFGYTSLRLAVVTTWACQGLTAMITFLLWNLMRKPLAAMVAAAAAEEHEVDIVVTMEAKQTQTDEDLPLFSSNFILASRNPNGVRIYTRFPNHWVIPLHDEDRTSIVRIEHPLYGSLLAVATHFPSKLHRSA